MAGVRRGRTARSEAKLPRMTRGTRRGITWGFVLLCAALTPLGETAAQAACRERNVPVYAHNDYLNPRPLAGALDAGFRGVEADLFLVNDTLRVGHDRSRARHGEAFETLYLKPLQEFIRQCDEAGILTHPFLLTVELKEKSRVAYDSLSRLLSRYNEHFARASARNTHVVEIVMVGWVPTGTVNRATTSTDSPFTLHYRIMSSDSNELADIDPRVRLLSLDYGKSIGRWWRTDRGRQRWYDVLRVARRNAPRATIRAHNVPPKCAIYQKLYDAGVDIVGSRSLTDPCAP